MNSRNTICLSLMLALLNLTGSGAFAQRVFDGQGFEQQSRDRLLTDQRQRSLSTLPQAVTARPHFQARFTTQTEVEKALAKVKAAKDSVEKDGAKDELLAALSAEYDNRMNVYDKHIESLEKQVEEMRERLSRRRKAKDEVVELKLKQLVSEADGLGWPSNSGRNSQFGWGSGIPTHLESNPFGNQLQLPSNINRSQNSRSSLKSKNTPSSYDATATE